MGLGCGLGGDDCGRIQAVKLIDQTEGKVDVLLVSKCREHQIQFANRSFNCPEGFQTSRVFGVIAPQKGVLKCISQLIDRRQTDRCGNASQRVCGSVHAVRSGNRRLAFKDRQFTLQRLQMSFCLFGKYFEKRRRNGDPLLPDFRRRG